MNKKSMIKFLAATAVVGAAYSALQDDKNSYVGDLPDHASGIQCYAQDGIDRTDTDFMRRKIDAVIESGEIYGDGWSVVTRGYQIPYLQGGHHNLELLKPDKMMLASLETQQINRDTAEIKSYYPDGHYAAPVVDDCMEGNSVVLEDKSNMLGETVVFEGTGTQALLVFARAAQAANLIATQNYDYRVFPDAGENEANSNGYGRAFAETASGRDPYQDMKAYGDQPLAGSPGLNIDIIKEAISNRYEGIENNPDMIVQDRTLYNLFLDDLEALHPVSQQEKALEHGKDMQVKTLVPEV